MIGYFLPIQDSGGWLITDPQNHDLWQLVLLEPGNKSHIVSAFNFPHLAAHAVVTFQTGNSDWDSFPKIVPALATKFGDQALHDVKNWVRQEIVD